MSKILYVVVPCYNEQEVFAQTLQRLCDKLGALIAAGKSSERSRVLFVNDGSRDSTWELIKTAFAENPLVCGITLSRNRGHQNALLAGLSAAREHCDFTISIDADLQDDIEVFDQMIDRYLQGAEIVYGVRSARTTDTAFKRGTAQGFYKFLEKMGVEVVYNHADYRLMGGRAMDALAEFREVNLFLRGLIPMLGFQTDTVYYERSPRTAVESKYPLKKMLALAADGVTGFSVKPLRMIIALGILICAFAFVAFVTTLVLSLCKVLPDFNYPIFSSLIGLGGLQIICTGIVGEYVGKTYIETKARPRFFISDSKIK